MEGTKPFMQYRRYEAVFCTFARSMSGLDGARYSQSSPSDQPGEAGQTPRGSDLDQRVRRDIGSAMIKTSSRAGGYVRAGHRPERITQRDPAYAPCADGSPTMRGTGV
jgi:hypothetical protein